MAVVCVSHGGETECRSFNVNMTEGNPLVIPAIYSAYTNEDKGEPAPTGSHTRCPREEGEPRPKDLGAHMGVSPLLWRTPKVVDAVHGIRAPAMETRTPESER